MVEDYTKQKARVAGIITAHPSNIAEGRAPSSWARCETSEAKGGAPGFVICPYLIVLGLIPAVRLKKKYLRFTESELLSKLMTYVRQGSSNRQTWFRSSVESAPHPLNERPDLSMMAIASRRGIPRSIDTKSCHRESTEGSTDKATPAINPIMTAAQSIGTKPVRLCSVCFIRMDAVPYVESSMDLRVHYFRSNHLPTHRIELDPASLPATKRQCVFSDTFLHRDATRMD